MTKTLWCGYKKNGGALEMPTYTKVTATKVDEITAGVQNLYRDEQGNEYVVSYNPFKRREEFTKIN